MSRLAQLCVAFLLGLCAVGRPAEPAQPTSWRRHERGSTAGYRLTSRHRGSGNRCEYFLGYLLLGGHSGT
jgi:hypothetical protein